MVDLNVLSTLTPNFHESKLARLVWILENIEEEAFRLFGASCPYRSMGFFELFDAIGIDPEVHEEGEWFLRLRHLL